MLKPIFSSDRLQPFSHVGRQSDAFSSLLDVSHDIHAGWPGYQFHPTEDGTAYSVTIELPGYKRDQVTVEVDNDDLLRVHAHRPTGRLPDGIEMALGTNVPHITFPHDADPTKVAAKLEDGLLTVTVPKVAAPAPRKVVVS